jgi:hypothetical protein
MAGAISSVVIEVPLRDGLALPFRRILIGAEVDSAVGCELTTV